MSKLSSKTWEIDNETDMAALGEQWGLHLTRTPEAITLFLDGDLGAGKTTLTRGILRAFGHTGAVKSPTYALLEAYELTERRVDRLDVYRLGDPEELEYMGIRDDLDEGSIGVIDWLTRGAGVRPTPDGEIEVETAGLGRQICFQA